jgi:hypothetical protein
MDREWDDRAGSTDDSSVTGPLNRLIGERGGERGTGLVPCEPFCRFAVVPLCRCAVARKILRPVGNGVLLTRGAEMGQISVIAVN